MFEDYTVNVNGLRFTAKYRRETVDRLFLPFLADLARLQRQQNRRVICFLAAPPAAGKTTLSLFLETLSLQHEGESGIQKITSIGMDGFHYHQDYIASHSVVRDGVSVPMKEVKGCPETFDLEKLKRKIEELRTKESVLWPAYFRNIHDVMEDAIKVEGKIILLEGNYLLLDEEGWRDLRSLCDDSLMILAEPDLLFKRLVERKMQGGTPEDEARAFVEKSDLVNAKRILAHSRGWDLCWELLPDGDYRERTSS